MPPQVPDLPPSRERPQLSVRASSYYSKAPSITPSNEADDEESLSDLSFDMPDDPEPPQYAGQDTRLTSQKFVDPSAYPNNWTLTSHIGSSEGFICTDGPLRYSS